MAAPFSSVADSGNKARGGSVLRYTPAVTTPVTSGLITLGATVQGQVAIYAALRNNSASTTFQVTANIGGFGVMNSTAPYMVDTSTLEPRLVLLGVTAAVNGASLSLIIQASAAAGTLDIDYLIVLNLRDNTIAAVAYDDSANLATAFGAGINCQFDMLFNPITDQNPLVRVTKTASNLYIPVGYRGPLPFLNVRQTTVMNDAYVLWAATNGAHWQFDNGAGTVIAAVPTITRYKAYLSPQ